MHVTKILAAAAAAAALANTALAQCSNYGQTFSNNMVVQGDDLVRVVALPFPFPYNGVNYSQITIGTNGFIRLINGAGPNSTATQNTETEALMLNTTATAAELNPRIAVCWDDLDPDAATPGVQYAFEPTQASVVWKNTPRFNNSTTVFANCECILTAAGEIILNYDASCTFNLSTSQSIVGISKSDNSVLAGTHLFDWSAIAPNTPVLDGTGYQIFTANTGLTPFDLTGGISIRFTPDGSTLPLDDYLANVGPLAACAPATFPIASSAATTIVGTGCSQAATVNSICELFTVNTGTNPMDIAGTSIKFTPSGTTYISSPGLGYDSSYTAATGVAMTDDQTVTGLSLGAMGSFTLGGVVYTTVSQNANGYVWMGNNTGTAFTPSLSSFGTLQARVAAMWTDLLPSGTAGGTGLVYWNTGANYLGTGLAYAQGTWENVMERSNVGTVNNCQITLVSNGDVYLAYGAITGGVTHSTLAGIAGGINPVAGAAAVSSNLFTGGVANVVGPVNLVTTPGFTAMSHTLTIPARLGQDFTMASTVPSNHFGIGVFAIGTVNINQPLDILVGTGMAPGCSIYTDASEGIFSPIPITAGATSFNATIYAPIPVLLYLQGIVGFTQAAAAGPWNGATLISSNGRTFTVGL